MSAREPRTVSASTGLAGWLVPLVVAVLLAAGSWGPFFAGVSW